MNRRTRLRLALASTLPVLLTVPVCCLLAALGAVSWDVPVAVSFALAGYAVADFVRRRPRQL
jgi:hypothetical protein